MPNQADYSDLIKRYHFVNHQIKERASQKVLMEKRAEVLREIVLAIGVRKACKELGLTRNALYKMNGNKGFGLEESEAEELAIKSKPYNHKCDFIHAGNVGEPLCNVPVIATPNDPEKQKITLLCMRPMEHAGRHHACGRLWEAEWN